METPNAAALPVRPGLGLSSREASRSDTEVKRPAFMVRVGKAVYELPAIQQWDLDGDGIITEEELAAAAVSHGKLQSQAVNYKRMVLGLLLLLVVSVGIMIASVVIGVRLSRETKVKGTRLLTTDGDVVQVEEVRRNATMLSLTSSAASTLYITQSAAILADSQGQRFLVEGSEEPGPFGG
eukprot:jgi/Mesen1/4389/ME000223S03461